MPTTNFGQVILVAPASSGANVRTHGIQRAEMIASTPYRSVNASARATRSGVTTRPRRRRSSGSPIRAPNRYPTVSPAIAATSTPAISQPSSTPRTASAATSPPANSSVSPGRKNPTSSPHSTNTKPMTAR